MFLCCAVIITVIHYCNFCQLSYWMRSAVATLMGLALLALLFSYPCRYRRTETLTKEKIFFCVQICWIN